MYSSCIFCSHDLGTNEVLEAFPIGTTLAIDSSKGRLWAVCPSCGRWNLAPIEERWEPVEAAEERFRGTRLRMQSGNVGVAQLADGTRLVRVGDALPGELAAWRYGSELRGRRKKHWLGIAIGGLITLAEPAAVSVRVRRRQKEIIYRIAGSLSPHGRAILIRETNLEGAGIRVSQAGEIAVSLPGAFSTSRRWLRTLAGRATPDSIRLSGAAAESLLTRVMVRINASGASDQELSDSLEMLERFGSFEHVLSHTAGGEMTLAARRWTVTKRLAGRAAAPGPGRMPAAAMLAIEMTLHEESERRALDALRDQWREAEEIAGIADALPGDA